MNDIPTTLYKYMPFRKEFFDNFYLRCTPRSALNDPFELRPSKEYRLDDIAGFPNVERIEELSPRQLERLQELVEVRFKKMGIISLSEERNNIIMWSHYANDHKGIAVELDTNNAFFSCNGGMFDLKEFRHVSYEHEEKRSKKVPWRFYENELPDQDHNKIFFEKSKCWDQECEYRIINDLAVADEILCPIDHYIDNLQSKHPSYTPKIISEKIVSLKYYPNVFLELWHPSILCMFKLPDDCILSVTCGALMSDDDKKYIKEKAKELNFIYDEAKLCDKEYKLNFL
ncbi:MAG: DUF2971 domain-containing protein [Thalassolituus sp.]|uniref:DUF2971 domain-containing protein n=1 Tax=Thalassolituus sp. TaxID=2030822 RepID=UPI0039824511